MLATNVNKAMRFDSGTIKSASLILRKADNESQYVGTFAMASFNKKTCVNTAKTWRKKYIKIHKCFCKYAIEDNQVA